MDIKAPPLVGTYGPAGAGKSTDKIRALPNAYYFANPGGLIPLVSLLRIELSDKRLADVTKVADIDQMRATVDRVTKQDRTIKAIVIDDFSMIAAKTERVVKATKKDGRMAYGIIAEKASEAFEEWRNAGLVVAVDTHIRPPDWAEDEDGNEKPHVLANLEALGGPSLPGRKAGPEMVKAFDIFYRVYLSAAALPTGLPSLGGGSGGYQEKWPWRYTAGPYAQDSYQWETKDRWGVASPSNGGELPMNLGEILRFVQRKFGTKWDIPRLADKAFAQDEEFVAWAVTHLLNGASEAEVYTPIAKRLLDAKRPIEHVTWVLRDIRDRVILERLHSPAAALAALGINIPTG